MYLSGNIVLTILLFHHLYHSSNSLLIDKRVINGYEVDPEQHTWAVMLKGRSQHRRSMNVCGATFITDSWVVSAAHCFYEFSGRSASYNTDPSQWHLHAGSPEVDLKQHNYEYSGNKNRHSMKKHSSRKNKFRPKSTNCGEYYEEKEHESFDPCKESFDGRKGLDFFYLLRDLFNNLWKRSKRQEDNKKQSNKALHLHLSKVIIHPNYNPASIEWDIALIKLNRSVSGPLADRIQPVALPPSSLDWPPSGEECVMVGWGCTRYGGPVQSKASLARLEVVPHDQCNKMYSYNAGLNLLHEFCAGYYDENHGICPGDSGSGLVCESKGQKYLSGVASATHQYEPESYPGIFTRVAAFNKWIREQMAKY